MRGLKTFIYIFLNFALFFANKSIDKVQPTDFFVP